MRENMFFPFFLATERKSQSVACDKVWAWMAELTTKGWHEMTRKSGRASPFGGMSKQHSIEVELSELQWFFFKTEQPGCCRRRYIFLFCQPWFLK